MMNTTRSCMAVILLALCAVASAGVGIWPWMTPAPELQFQADGQELSASLTITVNNSPAIIDTSTRIDKQKKTVLLGFVIIQNADLYRRSPRQVHVRWSLGEINRENYTFEVKGSEVDLTTKELKTLLPDTTAIGIGTPLAERPSHTTNRTDRVISGSAAY